jgi:hypothetical protein
MNNEKHPLINVFEACIEQVATGKGNQRHGNGREFLGQPWVELAETYGVGFLYGQGGKKLREAMKITDANAKNRELFGAINYIAMGIIYESLTQKTKE